MLHLCMSVCTCACKFSRGRTLEARAEASTRQLLQLPGLPLSRAETPTQQLLQLLGLPAGQARCARLHCLFWA